MQNFDRQYRMTAGKPGSVGFEIGDTTPYALHIAFSIQKQELESSNTAKVQVWNLNKSHLATLEEEGCFLTLKAGYGNTLPLILSGSVSYTRTQPDGADVMTEIEVVDGLAEIRDTWVSISYAGKVNSKKIIDDVAAQMGVTVTYSYNAEFADIPNGFSFVGQAKFALTKAWCRERPGVVHPERNPPGEEAGGRDEQGSVRSQRGDRPFEHTPAGPGQQFGLRRHQ